MFVEAPESEVTTAALQDELAEACGVANAANAKVVSLIGQALETEAWAQWGIHSPAHWVAWQCGFSPSHAHQLVSMAKRLAELPLTASAFGAGELSADQARVLCRSAPVGDEAELVELAKVATVSQLSRTLRRYASVEDEPPAEEAGPVPERRQVEFGPDEAGGWRLGAVLPPDEGALVERALGVARDRLFAEAEGAEVTWADALVEVAETSLCSAVTRRADRHRHTVLFHLDFDDPEHLAQLHLGSVLSDWLARYLTCDADVVPVVRAKGVPAQRGEDAADRARPHPDPGRAPGRGLSGAGL